MADKFEEDPFAKLIPPFVERLASCMDERCEILERKRGVEGVLESKKELFSRMQRKGQGRFDACVDIEDEIKRIGQDILLIGHELRPVNEAIKTIRVAIGALENETWARQFVGAVKSLLSKDEFEAICRMADIAVGSRHQQLRDDVEAGMLKPTGRKEGNPVRITNNVETGHLTKG